MRREQPRSTGRRSLWAAAPSPVGDGVRSYPEQTMNNILQHPTGYIESFGWSRSSANLPRVKRIGIVVGAVALVAVLVIGLSQAGGGGGGQGKSAGGACGKVSPSLSGAPAPLASLYGPRWPTRRWGPAA